MVDLFSYLRQRVDLPEGEIAWAQRAAQRRRLKRGDPFCQFGQVQHELGFLEAGILQFSKTTEYGELVVLDFLFPGGFAVALEAALNQQPASITIEAVTPVTISVWPYKSRLVARARDPRWGELEARLTEEAFLRVLSRRESLMTKSADKRYQELDVTFPRDWRKIPQRLLASYLHVTPQYLCRLKRRLTAAKRSDGLCPK